MKVLLVSFCLLASSLYGQSTRSVETAYDALLKKGSFAHKNNVYDSTYNGKSYLSSQEWKEKVFICREYEKRGPGNVKEIKSFEFKMFDVFEAIKSKSSYPYSVKYTKSEEAFHTSMYSYIASVGSFACGKACLGYEKGNYICGLKVSKFSTEPDCKPKN